MRRLVLLAFVLPLVAGCGWASLLFGGVASGGGGSQEALAPEIVQDVPQWVKDENLSASAVPGAQLFARAGCVSCHTYDGAGGQNLGAPDLTAIGRRHLGIAFEIRHLQCPGCVIPGSPMPRFSSLGQKRLKQVAIFLEASKGTR